MRYLSAVTVVILACLSLPPALAADDDSRKDASSYTSGLNDLVYCDLPFDDEKDYSNAGLGFISQPDPLLICKENQPPNQQGVCEEGEIWSLEEYKKFITSFPAVSEDNRSAPPTINPSLWRNAQLSMNYGLFRVTGDYLDNFYEPQVDPFLNLESLKAEENGIYQVRGYDLSNITFVKGDSGWIVFDPLISLETARAALDLINSNLGEDRPVVAVIYSHSHIDHYGGAGGLFGAGEQSNAVFIAPEGFTEHAVSENVIAGNAMSRRSMYMYGARLERDAKGSVNAGLGHTTSNGVAGLILPTILISERDASPLKPDGSAFESNSDGDLELSGGSVDATYDPEKKEFEIDGVIMKFQMTPGTEAPAEMNTWIPELSALWMAENTTNTMHNLLTLRGAQVRDASKWVSFLNETIELWGSEVLVKFQSHHWPLWADRADDNSNIISYLKMQRDIYKYIHDQTVRMMNNGLTGEEISEAIRLPESLENNWATRGYYGTLRHNSRAVYQYYMGWYDGHPSDLNNLPPEKVAKRYIEYMNYSGPLSVVERARNDFLAANAQVVDGSCDSDVDPSVDRIFEEYRWLAELLKHVVFAEAASKQSKFEATEAENLLADVLEQLGYLSESGPWRSVYLQGADELRNGKLIVQGGATAATPETLDAMPPEMVFDFFAVHLCPDQTAVDNNNECSVPAEDGAGNGDPLEIYVNIEDQQSDWNDQFLLTVDNAVLNYSVVYVPPAEPDLTLSLSMDELHAWMQDNEEIGGIEANPPDVFTRFRSMLDLDDDITFNIIRP